MLNPQCGQAAAARWIRCTQRGHFIPPAPIAESQYFVKIKQNSTPDQRLDLAPCGPAAREVELGDKVLEIGTGSEYQAAVLVEMEAKVVSIEIVESLAKTAREAFNRAGYEPIKAKAGDGYLGWPEQALFDLVIVTCSPERIPQLLVEQLRDGGRMVIPVGDEAGQQLYLLEKKNGKIEQQATLPVRFVPMTGEIEKE